MCVYLCAVAWLISEQQGLQKSAASLCMAEVEGLVRKSAARLCLRKGRGSYLRKQGSSKPNYLGKLPIANDLSRTEQETKRVNKK